ncbi:MAG: DUF2071 domain-containing protein [Anaerolineae bacterium]|nr:DUF2071 domain-containing protein [Anaerolineae bacterium]
MPSPRPYPAPTMPWVMRQTWHDLLFMHWPVPLEALRPHIPPSLSIDTFDGQAWIAVVPFRMSDIAPRALFPVPWLSVFPELNVRTYVIRDGKPGVWFFSLEAGNSLAVWLARTWFKLPYFHARMKLAPSPVPTGEGLSYVSHRIHPNAPSANFVGSYAPIAPPFEAQPGSLEYFLTARYCLYTTDIADADGRVYRGEIDHPPWPLQLAKAEVRANTMTDWLKITLPDVKPLLHFSRKLVVVVWGLEKI